MRRSGTSAPTTAPAQMPPDISAETIAAQPPPHSYSARNHIMTTPFRYTLQHQTCAAEDSPEGKAQYETWGPYSDASTGAAETRARDQSDKLNGASVWIVPAGERNKRWYVRA